MVEDGRSQSLDSASSTPPFGPRERTRQSLRADIDRVAAEHRLRGERPPSVIVVANCKADIEDRAPRKYRNERAIFYVALRDKPFDIQESMLVTVLGAHANRPTYARLKRTRPLKYEHRPPDPWRHDTLSNLFARLRPWYPSDRATYKAVSNALLIFFDWRLSPEGVKRRLAEIWRS